MSFSHGHALLIGVGSHRYAPHLDVPITVSDAQAVAEILLSEQYCGYLPDRVEVLHDAAATREGILGAIAGLADRAGAGDTVTIFYCGHGDYGADGEYYLIGHDARVTGVRVQPGTGVSQAELIAGLRQIKANKLLLIFNACHSGEISPSLGAGAGVGSQTLPDTAADALLSTGSGRVILTACREEQRSYIGKGGLTIFTQALVDGLKGKGISSRGGAISAFDLYTAVFESVGEVARDTLGLTQEPELTVLKGVGPFAVALYRGATETDLGLAEAGVLPPEAGVRQVSPERSQRLFQQIIQSGGVNFGQGNVIEIGRDVIGEQRVDTGGGAFVGGSVNTGGGTFVGRDQVNTSTATQGITLDQFTELLAELRSTVQAAKIDPKIQASVAEDISRLEEEASDANPSLPLIEARLEGIRAILQKAAVGGAAIIGLAEVVQKGIQMAQQLFR